MEEFDEELIQEIIRKRLKNGNRLRHSKHIQDILTNNGINGCGCYHWLFNPNGVFNGTAHFDKLKKKDSPSTIGEVLATLKTATELRDIMPQSTSFPQIATFLNHTDFAGTMYDLIDSTYACMFSALS